MQGAGELADGEAFEAFQGSDIDGFAEDGAACCEAAGMASSGFSCRARKELAREPSGCRGLSARLHFAGHTIARSFVLLQGMPKAKACPLARALGFAGPEAEAPRSQIWAVGATGEIALTNIAVAPKTGLVRKSGMRAQSRDTGEQFRGIQVFADSAREAAALPFWARVLRAAFSKCKSAERGLACQMETGLGPRLDMHTCRGAGFSRFLQLVLGEGESQTAREPCVCIAGSSQSQ